MRPNAEAVLHTFLLVSHIVQLLLKHGANIEQRDGNFETPLLQSARRGSVEMVHWLINRG